MKDCDKGEAKAKTVTFIRKCRWPENDSYRLTVPVGELAGRCMDSWLGISDERSACNSLPTGRLRARCANLVASDADQEAWDGFYEEVDETYRGMSADELAAEFVELNDPETIIRVLWSDGERDYVDSACEFEW